MTFEESIENLIEKNLPPLYRPERYISKFHPSVRSEWHQAKKSHNKTMGNAEEAPPEPANFLKKHSRELWSSSNRPTTISHECLLKEKRSPLPTKIPTAEKPRNIRDFLTENIDCAAKSRPPATWEKLADSKKGYTEAVKNSGLQPHYIYKKTYGTRPLFVKQKRTLPIKSSSSDSSGAAHNKRLSSEQRAELLQGLKKNLQEKNKQFLLLPVIIDTPYLINCKRKLEKSISQLEKDIEEIENHAVIYIHNDD